LLIQDKHIPHLPHGGEENGQPDLIPGVRTSLVLSVPGRIVTLSTKTGILGI